MRYIIPCSILLLLASCNAARYATAGHSEQRDSISVEVRTQIIQRIDTAYVEIPLIQQSVTTHDTTSVLDNEYAVSRASILADGQLLHELETKPQTQAVAVTANDITRDSIIYREHTVYIETPPVEVEKPLSAFVRMQIRGFWILLLLCGLYIYIKIKKKRLFPFK
ncbi:MAG: hypothetical protein MJY71_02365 [Bacteroidaceae bacterium]|nr:hypothetical protein [Bacteroidaceae bacterium]